MNRPENELKNLRPEVFTETEKAGTIEAFQNDVLRPILKFQHELFLAEANAHPLLKRCFQKETIEQQRQELKQFFGKNAAVKYVLIGMVIGLMTNEEFVVYLTDKSTYDKRLTNMLMERLIDGMSH